MDNKSIADGFLDWWPVLVFLVLNLIGLVWGWARFELKQKQHDIELAALKSTPERLAKLEANTENIQKSIDEVKAIVLQHLVTKKA